MKTAYGSANTCFQLYKPTLTQNLINDGVQNASFVANSLMSAYALIPAEFDVMCTENQKGQFCMPMYYQMSQALAATNASGTLAVLCDSYFNLGCCLTTLSNLYSTIVPNFDWVTAMAGICPILQNFNPPPCIEVGQKAVALNVVIPLKGLDCSSYASQSTDFKTQVEVAIRQDLANGPVGQNLPTYTTTVSSITQSGSSCDVTVVVRASDDTTTKSFTNAAGQISALSLTLTNQALGAEPTTLCSGSSSVTMGQPTVTQVTLSGYPVGHSSAGVALNPGHCMVALLALLWFA